MKAGIIAAGEGSRFVQSGIHVPKPLLRVGGVTLLERTLRTLVRNGATEVALIVNERMPELVDHAQSLGLPVPLRPVIRTTPSSMHSLHALASILGDDRFLLCTVDSVVRPEEAAGFVSDFRAHPEADLELAYTGFVDDEKPLRIAVDDAGRVTALGEAAADQPLCTVGMYGLSPAVLPLLDRTVAQGLTTLRTFLGAVVDSGFSVRGYRFTKAIDVDRPHDVEVAEAFLSGETPCN